MSPLRGAPARVVTVLTTVGLTTVGLTTAGLAVPLVGAGAPAAAATARPSTTSASTSASTSATGARPPVEVRLTQVGPAAYQRPAGDGSTPPDRGTVTVRGTIRNTGDRPLEGVTVRLLVQRSALRTRQAVEAWAAAEATAPVRGGFTTAAQMPAGTLAPGAPSPLLTPGRLDAGAEASFVLTADAADLGTTPGAHATAVEVRADGEDGDAERVGIARTFLTAAPGGPVQPTRITLLAPLVTAEPLPDEAPLDGLADPAALDEALTGGSPAQVLAATADPRIAWALDPALLASATAAAQLPVEAGPPGDTTGAADPAAQPTAAATWLTALQAGARDRSVVALPYADPDLAALARAGNGTALLTAAEDAGAAATDLLGVPVLDDVAWPAGGAGSERTHAFVARGGDDAVVLDGRSLPVDRDLTYTPTGLTTVDTEAGELLGLVADEELSTALEEATEQGGQVAAVQRFLAEAATVTLQRPSDSRSLLAVAPRGWEPSPAAVTALLAALESSPWAQLQPLPQLLAEEPPADAYGEPEAGWEEPAQLLPTAHLESLAVARRQIDALAAAVPGEAPELQDLRRALLGLTSVAWRGDLEQLRLARERLTAITGDLLDGVHIVAGSDRNLVATRSEMPVTVVNELPVPVTVDLLLRPRTPRLQLTRSSRLTLEPESQQRVGIPVEALANGTVVVDAQLRTPDGTVLGTPVPITVNIRMSVESWIIGGIAGSAALMLVVGLVRAVRRGKRRMDEADTALPAPDRTQT